MLGMMVFMVFMVLMVSRVKQSILKGFRNMEPDLESSGLRLENWF